MSDAIEKILNPDDRPAVTAILKVMRASADEIIRLRAENERLHARIARLEAALAAWQALEDQQGGMVLAGNPYHLTKLLNEARRLTAEARQ